MKWIFGVFISPVVFAKPQWAQIITDGALVYREANFDAEVVAQLQFGKTYRISQKLYGAFYRILLAPKKIGYIADVDVQIVENQVVDGPPTKKPKKTEKKLFFTQRWRGFSFSQIQFAENTMGQTYSAPKPFYGVKLAGPDLALEGQIPTEVNFYYSGGAPDYYAQKTGRGSGGWIFISDFHWQYYFPQGSNTLSFFGFGPMLRYSKFDVELSGVSSIGYYSMEDIILGGSFNLGVAQRFSSISARLEAQYYWETAQYWGLAASILFAF